jgi:DNA-binding transcriptional LysR family regulator
MRASLSNEMLVCPRDDPLARRRKVSWQELQKHCLIGVSRESGNRIVLDNALARANIQIGWFYEVNHLSTAFGLTETGIGAAVLPRLATPPTKHPTTETSFDHSIHLRFASFVLKFAFDNLRH